MRFVGLGICLVLLSVGCQQDANTPGAATASSAAPTQAAAATQPDAQTVSAFDLAIGDCLNRPRGKAARLGDVEVVPCDRTHDMEVYGVYDIPQGPKKPYPGRKPVRRFARETCRSVIFTQYVGVDHATSDLLALERTPVAKTWRRGDREVVCFAHAGDEQLTASVKDSGR